MRRNYKAQRALRCKQDMRQASVGKELLTLQSNKNGIRMAGIGEALVLDDQGIQMLRIDVE